MKTQKEFSGTISYLSASPHGEPEGVVLEDGSFIKLPPHVITMPSALEVGKAVTGQGELINETPNRVFHHALLKIDGVTVADDRKDKEKYAPDHTAPKKKSSRVVGRLVSIATKPKGEVDRMILDDGTSIHLPKELELFADDMLIGRTYQVTGELRSFDKLKFLKAESVEGIV